MENKRDNHIESSIDVLFLNSGLHDDGSARFSERPLDWQVRGYNATAEIGFCRASNLPSKDHSTSLTPHESCLRPSYNRPEDHSSIESRPRFDSQTRASVQVVSCVSREAQIQSYHNYFRTSKSNKCTNIHRHTRKRRIPSMDYSIPDRDYSF